MFNTLNTELKCMTGIANLAEHGYQHLTKNFELAPIGILVLNPATEILQANSAAMELLNPTQQLSQPLKLLDFINADDLDAFQAFIHAVLNQVEKPIIKTRLKPVQHEYHPLACEGIQYYSCVHEQCTYNVADVFVEMRANLNLDSDEPIIYLSMFDISDSNARHEAIVCLNHKLQDKISEQTLSINHSNNSLVDKSALLATYKRKILEREAMLNAIFNAATEGIITIYLSGAIFYSNTAVEKIFYYSQQQLNNINIKDLIFEEQQQDFVDYLKMAVINDFTSKDNTRELQGIRQDGSLVPLDISIAKFYLDGQCYLSAIVKDISSRKLREKRDQEHLDELAHVTRLGLMGEMASGIAHEVNQPLSAIVNYTQASLNLLEKTDLDQALLEEVLVKTNQQALRAGQIIHRMREFVKSKKQQISKVAINQLIDDAVALCDAYFKQDSIQLKMLLSDDIPDIEIDKVQIEQVVLNLIRNSIDALIGLPISHPRQLSIETTLNSHQDLEVRIKDNALGIDTDQQKNILRPFYTTKPDGMGMGLSICRSIIEAHNGNLRFNSQPDKGTTFYFTLPIRKRNNGF